MLSLASRFIFYPPRGWSFPSIFSWLSCYIPSCHNLTTWCITIFCGAPDIIDVSRPHFKGFGLSDEHKDGKRGDLLVS